MRQHERGSIPTYYEERDALLCKDALESRAVVGERATWLVGFLFWFKSTKPLRSVIEGRTDATQIRPTFVGRYFAQRRLSLGRFRGPPHGRNCSGPVWVNRATSLATGRFRSTSTNGHRRQRVPGRPGPEGDDRTYRCCAAQVLEVGRRTVDVDPSFRSHRQLRCRSSAWSGDSLHDDIDRGSSQGAA